eukprot:939536-Rhodomonas_salina.4
MTDGELKDEVRVSSVDVGLCFETRGADMGCAAARWRARPRLRDPPTTTQHSLRVCVGLPEVEARMGKMEERMAAVFSR